MPTVHAVTALTGVLLAALATLYAVLALIAALIWQARRPASHCATTLPPVTLLKPLCGAEQDLYENLRSFCLQDYPVLQIVCGVRDAHDPAVSVVRRLAREFPALPIELVIDGSQHGSNRKVSNLINMLPHAGHDFLIIADSDVRVGADYLRGVAPALLDPGTGLLTSLYRSVPAAGICSRLGSMYVNDWYMPSVMLAWLFGNRTYVSGQTMGVRRDTLVALGGFATVVNHLADDYELGQRVRALGLRIALSRYVPETVQEEPSAGALKGHALRWMRTVRALAPAGFRFLFVSFTLPVLAAAFALAATQPSLALRLLPLLWVSLLARIGLCCLPRLSQRRIAFSDLCLLPLLDLLLCWAWARALVTSRISWRGGEFVVDGHGVMRSSP
jgi:ceramide glucosyltransferase